MATPALPRFEASRFHRPGNSPGLSRSGGALGVIASGFWTAVGVGFLLHDDHGRIGGLTAMAVAAGIGFVATALRDTRAADQWAAAFRLGRMSIMLERAAARSRPSRRPGRTPAEPEPSEPTPRTDAASAETSTRSAP